MFSAPVTRKTRCSLVAFFAGFAGPLQWAESTTPVQSTQECFPWTRTLAGSLRSERDVNIIAQRAVTLHRCESLREWTSVWGECASGLNGYYFILMYSHLFLFWNSLKCHGLQWIVNTTAGSVYLFLKSFLLSMLFIKALLFKQNNMFIF